MDKKELRKRKEETGKRIKEIRESMNMSKEQFAKLIGMSGQYLGTLERGVYYISTDKLIPLCEKTGISSDYILFGKRNPINDEMKKLLLEFDCSDLDKAFKIIENLAICITENKQILQSTNL